MPNFVVFGESAARKRWVSLLQSDFKKGEAKVHSYDDSIYAEGQYGYLEQKKALEQAEAVLVIVPSSFTVQEMHNDIERQLASAYGDKKGLPKETPIYLVLSDVTSKGRISEVISHCIAKPVVKSVENTKANIDITIYQVGKSEAKGKEPKEGSEVFVHDIFGYKGFEKFPLSLKSILSKANLEQRRGLIVKSQGKAESTSRTSLPSSSSEKATETKTSSVVAQKDPACGYKVVLKKSVDDLSQGVKPNELHLALDDQDFLYYSVIDPKNTLQTKRKIEKNDLEYKLPPPHTYGDFVEAFKEALGQNNITLLYSFLPALLDITTERNHTTKDLFLVKKPAPKTKEDNRLKLQEGYVIHVMASTDGIADVVPLNQLRMALVGDKSNSSLHYAIRDQSGAPKNGVIDSSTLKIGLKDRYEDFCEKFNRVLLDKESVELLRPFVDPILAILSAQGCQLEQATKISEAGTRKGSPDDKKIPKDSGSGRKSRAASSPDLGKGAVVPLSSPSSDASKPSQSKKRWSASWTIFMGFLTPSLAALTGFILEIVLPLGFLGPGGVMATAIAGTFLAALTPVGAYVLGMLLFTLLVAGVTFCIHNRAWIEGKLDELFSESSSANEDTPPPSQGIELAEVKGNQEQREQVIRGQGPGPVGSPASAPQPTADVAAQQQDEKKDDGTGVGLKIHEYMLAKKL